MGSVIRGVWLVVAMSVTLVVTGCASSPQKGKGLSFEDAMSNAEAKVGAGNQEAAITAFEDVTKLAPTRKEPWVRIAQLQFDRGQYARAIVAAEEVLQRDPSDLVADGVITVAGLRVASQSLNKLQGRGVLVSESAKQEAKTLEKSLKSIADKDELASNEKEKPVKRVKRSTGRKAVSADVAEAPAKPAAPQQGSKGKANPFRNLGL